MKIFIEGTPKFTMNIINFNNSFEYTLWNIYSGITKNSPL